MRGRQRKGPRARRSQPVLWSSGFGKRRHDRPSPSCGVGKIHTRSIPAAGRDSPHALHHETRTAPRQPRRAARRDRPDRRGDARPADPARSIIDRLIAVKRTSASGSAFRPGREASMMRRVAERHRGLLPLDTVEGIWRVIIATFTWVQAPFSVHADVSGGDAPMRDSARFHFGFTVPYRPHPTCAAVVEAVAASRGDLGIFRLDPEGSAPPSPEAPWWEGLVGEGRPKVIARLPFIERPTHPAGTPVSWWPTPSTIRPPPSATGCSTRPARELVSRERPCPAGPLRRGGSARSCHGRAPPSSRRAGRGRRPAIARGPGADRRERGKPRRDRQPRRPVPGVTQGRRGPVLSSRRASCVRRAA